MDDGIKTTLIDFLSAYLLVIIIFTIGALFLIFVPASNDANLTINSVLVARQGNLLGTVTSIFINGDWITYFGELSGWIVPLMFLILINQFLIKKERVFRANLFTTVSFIGGVLATFIWELLPLDTFSYGASGVGYAALGVIFGFALFNISNIHSLSKRKLDTSNLRQSLGLAFSIAVPVIFAAYIILFPKSFFVIEPHVNSLLHEIGFLVGIFATIFLLYLEKSKQRKSSSPGTLIPRPR